MNLPWYHFGHISDKPNCNRDISHKMREITIISKSEGLGWWHVHWTWPVTALWLHQHKVPQKSKTYSVGLLYIWGPPEKVYI